MNCFNWTNLLKWSIYFEKWSKCFMIKMKKLSWFMEWMNWIKWTNCSTIQMKYSLFIESMALIPIQMKQLSLFIEWTNLFNCSKILMKQSSFIVYWLYGINTNSNETKSNVLWLKWKSFSWFIEWMNRFIWTNYSTIQMKHSLFIEWRS